MNPSRRRYPLHVPRWAEDDPYAEDPRANYMPEDEPVIIARCRCGAPLGRLNGWTMTTCFDCADPPDAA